MRFIPVVFLFGIAACQNISNQIQSTPDPIVLGDSSTIVTETDTNYLGDLVSDITPKEFIQSAVEKAPETQRQPATVAPTETAEPVTKPTVASSGASINFGQGVQVVITGITTKEFQQQNPEKDAGVSYAVATGDLLKSDMHISGLEDIKVKQRYQSYLVLSANNQQLSLQNMGGYLSDWAIMPLKNDATESVVSMSGLANVKFKTVSNSTIKNAVRRAARSSRMSNTNLNQWLKAVSKTKSANDEPCVLKIDNVQWQISGKTKDGHRFFKTMRMDI